MKAKTYDLSTYAGCESFLIVMYNRPISAPSAWKETQILMPRHRQATADNRLCGIFHRKNKDIGHKTCKTLIPIGQKETGGCERIEKARLGGASVYTDPQRKTIIIKSNTHMKATDATSPTNSVRGSECCESSQNSAKIERIEIPLADWNLHKLQILRSGNKCLALGLALFFRYRALSQKTSKN